MTLNEEITIIEDLIKSRLVKSSLGIKQVYTGDLSASLQFPSVNIINKGASMSDTQILTGQRVGLILEFDINCMFSGAEAEFSLKNAQKFTNNVYDLLQKESLTGNLLDGNCLDLDCTEIQHGTLNFNDVFVYGGLITLEIEILHNIGE